MVRWTANHARIAATLHPLINTHRIAAATLAFRAAHAFADAIGGAALVAFRADLILRATLVAALRARRTTFTIIQAFAITANARFVGTGRA